MSGKDQPYRQQENTSHVSGPVLKTKKIWPARSCRGGTDHREQKCHVFCDTKAAAASHTVWSSAVTKAGGRQWLERHMEIRDPLIGCMQEEPAVCVKALYGNTWSNVTV